jgi:hypothetical protein
VLASVQNDQVRCLSAGQLVAREALVYGRDPNSIYEDQHVPLRPAWARARLQEIVRLIDDDQRQDAIKMIAEMEQQWGDDGELVRLRAWLG